MFRKASVVAYCALTLLSVPFLTVAPARAQTGVATPASLDPCASPPATPAAMATPEGDHEGHDMEDMSMDLEFDLAFIDAMIPHHAGAIEMAEIALTRAEHPEIKALAEAIISSQSAEIEQLTAWRTEWYGDAPAVTQEQIDTIFAMDGHGMAMGDDAAKLCDVAGSFDLAFIDAMIPHHASAVMMAQMALEFSTHAEIKTLAASIIAAQQSEIDQMTEWKSAWSS